MIMVNMTIASEVKTTSTAGAFTYNTVFAAADVTSATDWADYKSLYQEFRVVGVQTKFVPKLKNATPPLAAANGTLVLATTSVIQPLFMCKAHGDVVAITTLDQAANHMDQKMNSINEPLSVQIKMVETDEAQWNSTTSGTTGVFGIKSYFAGTTTAGGTEVVSWGTMFETFAVQFRGRVVSATALRAKVLVADQKDQKEVVAVKPLSDMGEKLSAAGLKIVPLTKGASWYDESEYELVRKPTSANPAK